MSTGTRRPSLSRYPSVALERQSSITSHSSNAFFDEQEETSSSGRTIVAEKEGIWNTTRRKLTLVSLCLVYFAATASFAILSPFFPSEVSYVNDFSPKFRLRRVESQRRVPFRITALISMARGQQIGLLFFRRINRISRATLIKNNRFKAYTGRKFGPGSIAYRHVWVAFDYVTFISEYQRSTQACLFI